MNCDLDTSIPDWIIEHQVTERVFNQLQLDISCGGKSLRYVCQQQGLDPNDVLRQLIRAISEQADDSA